MLCVSILLEEAEGASREVVCAECVLEARVAGAGVDEVGEAELPDVSQTLERAGVDQSQGEWVDADVVPEWVTDDFVHGIKLEDRRMGG
jgi:hypothetical protein